MSFWVCCMANKSTYWLIHVNELSSVIRDQKSCQNFGDVQSSGRTAPTNILSLLGSLSLGVEEWPEPRPQWNSGPESRREDRSSLTRNDSKRCLSIVIFSSFGLDTVKKNAVCRSYNGGENPAGYSNITLASKCLISRDIPKDLFPWYLNRSLNLN